MSACLHHERQLSAWLDGEIAAEAASAALAHALVCAGCQEFYRTAVALEDEIAAAFAPRPRSAATEESNSSWARWSEIARRAATPAASGGGLVVAFPRSARRRHGPALAAAALVVCGLGLGVLLARPWSRGERLPAAAMTDARFVDLAGELLSAEPRYQRTMLEVLRETPAVAEDSGRGDVDLPRFTRSPAETGRPEGGEV